MTKNSLPLVLVGIQPTTTYLHAVKARDRESCIKNNKMGLPAENY